MQGRTPISRQRGRAIKMIDIQQFADEHRLRTRVDEDRTKVIPGKLGHLFEYDDDLLGVMVMPDPPKRNYWGDSRLIDRGRLSGGAGRRRGRICDLQSGQPKTGESGGSRSRDKTPPSVVARDRERRHSKLVPIKKGT